MARTEARLFTSIWTDRDFIHLSPGAQRLYQLLLSQPGLTNAGTLAITLRRWASYSPETSVEDIEKQLAELEAHPFVVIDWDTEELLVRSLLRNDEVYKQPNMLVNVCKEAAAITSARLRSVLRSEVLRLPITDEDKAKTTSRKVPLMEVVGTLLEILAEPFPDTLNNPSGNPSPKTSTENPSPNPEGYGGGEVVGSSGKDKNQKPTTKTLAQNRAASADFDRFWEIYPRRVAKGDALKAWTKAIKKTDPETIIEGAKRYADDPIRKPDFTAYPASWLNAERWLDEPSPPGSNGRYSNQLWNDDTKVEI